MDRIDFLCINCQELICQDNITQHSLICVYPTSSVMSIELQPIFQQLLYKIKKLKSALMSHISQENRQIDKELYEFLVQQADDLLNIEESSNESLDKCKSTLNTLDRYSNANLSTSILLYTERLKIIAQSFIQELEKNLDYQVNPLDKKYMEIQQARENVGKAKISNTHNIDEISSQISQIWNGKHSAASMTNPDDENQKQDLDELDNMFKQNESERNKKTAEDLQRYFFSRCLVTKLASPAKDLTQYIQIPELYKSVQELKIPVEKWEEFIREQFSHPERWVNPGLIINNK
ncbi:hypothetical protein SteCoe_15027 [Stentor coeruleus]|uniref:Uncharacterized protein n=1 Tax=Stentor coeruleus TaxID=5963 RepID=A0A1R2C4I2_9CILI|nr:hypothetical protein SteCoe_15027 [Stentor coeruleus]